MRAWCLKASDLDRGRFLELVRGLHSRDSGSFPRRIWVDAPDGWAFDWWRGLEGEIEWCQSSREPARKNASDCLARATAGRLFAPDGELRWRVVPALGEACWRTVFLGSSDWVGSALEDWTERLAGLSRTRMRVYLWGQRTKASGREWIELRIPHRFRYPVEAVSRNVIAVVDEWQDELGEPHFVRLCDLEAAKEDLDA